MSGSELSVIVTAHDETVVCGPTMASADLAIAAAQASGIQIEKLIALDNATPQTTEYFEQPQFESWTLHHLTEGDLGRARNEMISRSTGRWLAFLDADDLFSENWLHAGVEVLRLAQSEGRKVIVHPEINWLFDGASSVFCNTSQDDPLFSPYYLYIAHYYDSLCLAPREAHLDIPYVPRDIPRGLSFQDWQFTVETMSAGWRHVIAPDTIIFKRRRDQSLVTESSGRRAIIRSLDAMAIDRIDRIGLAADETKRGASDLSEASLGPRYT